MSDIEQTFGAMFIGVLVSMIIYGITLIQSHFYFANHPKDDHGEKALVAGIWILETLHIVLLSHTLYTYFISGNGDERVLLEGTWSLFASIAVDVIVAFTVQCYFTRRIFTLSLGRHKWWISFVTGLLVFAHLFFGIEMVVYFFIKKEFIHFRELSFQVLLPFLIVAVSSDVLIAVALCLLLAGDRSEFDATNNAPNTLIIYAINRCTLTCAVAIAQIVVFIVLPHSFFLFAFGFVFGRFYANSLLATLNARPVMRYKSSGIGTSTSFSVASVPRWQLSTNHSGVRSPHDDHMPVNLGWLEMG